MNFRIFGDTVRASPSSANERTSLVCTPDWRVSVTRTRYFPARSASAICLPSISIATRRVAPRRDTQKPIFRSVDPVSERANLRAVFIKFYIRHLLDFHLRARTNDTPRASARVFLEIFRRCATKSKCRVEMQNASRETAAREGSSSLLGTFTWIYLNAGKAPCPSFLIFCFHDSCVYRARFSSRPLPVATCAHIEHYKHSIIVMRY